LRQFRPKVLGEKDYYEEGCVKTWNYDAINT